MTIAHIKMAMILRNSGVFSPQWNLYLFFSFPSPGRSSSTQYIEKLLIFLSALSRCATDHRVRKCPIFNVVVL